MKKTTAATPAAKEADDHDSVRQRILDAAFKLFTTRGYADVSTLDIATLAKVSKRELYAQFKSKQALLAAGIAARTRRMRPPELPPVTSKAALEATLIAFGTRLMREVSDPHVVGMHRLAAAEATRAPELAATLHEGGRQTNHRILAELLREAQGAGLLDGGEPRELAAQFAGLLWGDMLVRLMLGVSERPTEREADKRARAAATAFLKLHGN